MTMGSQGLSQLAVAITASCPSTFFLWTMLPREDRIASPAVFRENAAVTKTRAGAPRSLPPQTATEPGASRPGAPATAPAPAPHAIEINPGFRRALVLGAIRDGRELEIVYLKPDDTKSRRRIRPEAVEMMEYHGRTFEGVRAYCHKRGKCRTFRLDRMLEVSDTD
jgi:predicted DNA-binding transcriptional regulator YafY